MNSVKKLSNQSYLYMSKIISYDFFNLLTSTMQGHMGYIYLRPDGRRYAWRAVFTSKLPLGSAMTICQKNKKSDAGRTDYSAVHVHYGTTSGHPWQPMLYGIKYVDYSAYGGPAKCLLTGNAFLCYFKTPDQTSSGETGSSGNDL